MSMRPITGVRREGIYAGVMMLTRKFSQALALFIVGLALEAFGFTKGAEAQNAAALNGYLVGFSWWAPACWRSWPCMAHFVSA